MRKVSLVLCICFVTLLTMAQAPPPKWQSATVTEVRPHGTVQDDPDRTQYEVSVKLGDTVYVVLFTAPPGSQTVRYRAGLSIQVLVESDTITFNDLLGRANKLPILRRTAISKQ